MKVSECCVDVPRDSARCDAYRALRQLKDAVDDLTARIAVSIDRRDMAMIELRCLALQTLTEVTLEIVRREAAVVCARPQ